MEKHRELITKYSTAQSRTTWLYRFFYVVFSAPVIAWMRGAENGSAIILVSALLLLVPIGYYMYRRETLRTQIQKALQQGQVPMRVLDLSMISVVVYFLFTIGFPDGMTWVAWLLNAALIGIIEWRSWYERRMMHTLSI